MGPSGDEFEHVQCLVDQLPTDLSDLTDAQMARRAEEFIKSRVNVFSRSDFDIGLTVILTHPIDTGDSAPHYERLRRQQCQHIYNNT